MGLTKNGYLDPKIEFSTKKYIKTRILVSGHDQTSALPPHLTVTTVSTKYPYSLACFFLRKEILVLTARSYNFIWLSYILCSVYSTHDTKVMLE